MNYHTTLITLGLLLTAIPHLGFPGSWKTGIFTLGGLAVAACAYALRRNTVDTKQKEDVVPVIPEPEAEQNSEHSIHSRHGHK